VPFIAQIKLSNSHEELFTIVKPMQDKSLIFLHPVSGKWESLAELEFGEIFTGVALFVEKGDSAGEAGFERKIVAERKQILKKIAILAFLPLIIAAMTVNVLFQHGILPAAYLSLSAI